MLHPIRPPALAGAMALALTVAADGSQAAYIVDTGAGAGLHHSWALNSTQALGATFAVASDTVIRSVQGWIGTERTGTIRIDLYAGGQPSGSPIHTATSEPIDAGPFAWNGVMGLSWAVTAGTYTVTYSDPTGVFSGAMPGEAPNPLQTEWFNSNLNFGWVQQDTLDIGVRVAATPVPEPSAAALLALGLAGAGAFSARRRMRAP
jgi:hypothetical protein